MQSTVLAARASRLRGRGCSSTSRQGQRQGCTPQGPDSTSEHHAARAALSQNAASSSIDTASLPGGYGSRPYTTLNISLIQAQVLQELELQNVTDSPSPRSSLDTFQNCRARHHVEDAPSIWELRGRGRWDGLREDVGGGGGGPRKAGLRRVHGEHAVKLRCAGGRRRRLRRVRAPSPPHLSARGAGLMVQGAGCLRFVEEGPRILTRRLLWRATFERVVLRKIKQSGNSKNAATLPLRDVRITTTLEIVKAGWQRLFRGCVEDSANR